MLARLVHTQRHSLTNSMPGGKPHRHKAALSYIIREHTHTYTHYKTELLVSNLKIVNKYGSRTRLLWTTDGGTNPLPTHFDKRQICTEFRRMFPGNRWQFTPKPVDLMGESGVEIERVVREGRRFCSILFCRRCLLLYNTLLHYCTKLKEESLRIFPTTGGKPHRSQADPQHCKYCKLLQLIVQICNTRKDLMLPNTLPS